MSEPLRQPRSFWQWLTNQEGTLFAPPPPPRPRSALSFIESELVRMHDQMEGLRGDKLLTTEEQGYIELVKTLSKLHDELVRRSKEESDEDAYHY